jgi:hypothetical protein
VSDRHAPRAGPRGPLLRIRLTAALIPVVLGAAAGCPRREPPQPPPPPVAVPHGFSSTLQVLRDGHLYRFGPFVGYYFRPVERANFDRVEFVCFNERGFYASDTPQGERLFTGEGVLVELEPVEGAMPEGDARIQPVFFDDAPAAWTGNRPEPQDKFLHFHSTYDATGATLLGYWLSHRAVAGFTYDMGGRVDRGSPLWHRVSPGPDRDFPRIIEFDSGPKGRP